MINLKKLKVDFCSKFPDNEICSVLSSLPDYVEPQELLGIVEVLISKV